MSTRIVELSQVIAENTKVVDDYFTTYGLPTPSFDIDGPQQIAIPPKEENVVKAHTAVLDATKELNLLMTGPHSVILDINPNDCLSLQAIYHYKIAQVLPVGQTRSFEHLSLATGLNVIDLRRLLRHAMCNSFFCEPRPGYVAHTAASRVLAENSLMYNIAGILTEEHFSSAAKAIDALVMRENTQCQDPAETGFALAHRTSKGMYEYMAAHPEQNERYMDAMNSFSLLFSAKDLTDGYNWAILGKGIVVDVGGGWGSVSVGIAQWFPNLDFIVQDVPDIIASGSEHIPTAFRDRIEFMSYDFIAEKQPIEGASLYLFREVFQTWPDDYSVRILRNQIPALNPGSRLLINEFCLPEPNTLCATREKLKRSKDVTMLAVFGSHLRTVGEWESLLEEADPRFHLQSIKKPPGDTRHILDIVWDE